MHQHQASPAADRIPFPVQSLGPEQGGLVSLGDDPGMFQTLGSCGSFLRHQFQHGQEERAELGGFLSRPLVLIYQDFKEAPRFEL